MVEKIRIIARTGKAVDSLNKLLVRIPKYMRRNVKNVAYIMAEEMSKSAASAGFAHPTGYLKKSIKTRPGRRVLRGESYYVTMPHYAWFVDKGRRAGKWPPPPSKRGGGKIVRWAHSIGMPYGSVRMWIGKRGTDPKPFVMRGIRNGIRRIRDKRHLLLEFLGE